MIAPGRSGSIRCDNGPEYISNALAAWAQKHKITLMFIQPDQPQQYAYVERYNRTVRYDWMNRHIFNTIEQAQLSATKWLWAYNNVRPNTAIGGVPPREKLRQHRKMAA